MFTRELNFFIAHQEELVKEHQGKVLAIQGETILGVYDTPLQAYTETQKTHELGTFMIQICQPGTQAYTMTMSH